MTDTGGSSATTFCATPSSQPANFAPPPAHLYDWEVRVGAGREVVACGMTDRPFRAFGHVIRAVAAVPRGTVASGRVVVCGIAPGGAHPRFQLAVEFERDAEGLMRAVAPFTALKISAGQDSAAAGPSWG